MSAGVLFGATAHAQPITSTSVVDATPDRFEPGQLLPGDSVRYQLNIVDFSNDDDYSNLEFSFDISDAHNGMVVGPAVPAGYDNSCGGTIDLAAGNETVNFTGGATPAGLNQSCFIAFDISVPDDIPEGTYTISAGQLTGYASGVTNANFSTAIADASFTVVEDTVGPTTVISVPGSFLPEAPFTAGFSFSEPVDGFTIADIDVTGATLSDFSIGDPGADPIGDPGAEEIGAFETGFSVTVTPTGPGTVTLGVDAGAAQDEADNDSGAAAASVEIIEPADLDVEFVENPADAGDTVTLRYTITNTSATNAMSGVRVDVNLDAIIDTMAANAAFPATPCGAGSSLSGTTYVVMIGGDIAAGSSCTFDVSVGVPAGASAGSYAAATPVFAYTIDGVGVTGDPVSVGLTVAGAEGGGAPLSFSAAFLTSPVVEGGSSTLEFSIAPAEGTDATDLAFTLDLDAVLSGMVADDLPLSDACGTGSSVTGTSTIALTGGNLLEGEVCTFEVDVTLPAGSGGGGFVFTTSNLTGNADDGDSVSAINADPASDTLTVLSVVPSATITGPSADVGATFTIEVRFSEAITGFDVADLTVTNGVASDLSAAVGTDFTATITPAAAGAVTVQLPADTVADADLNGNTVSNLFSVTAVTPEPEIAVSGQGVTILDGDTTPSGIDGTNFGATDSVSGLVDRTFVINNSGTGDLTLAGGPTFVTIGGADAADFSVLTQPTSPVAAGGSSSFQIRYDPSAVATDTATITILSDDADEATYTFDITGSGTSAPEINVTGNAVTIVDGDTTPSATDDTLFGAVNIGENLARTFTIENTGSAVLTLGTNAVQLVQSGTDFTVTSQPATTVGVGSSTTFEITFAPTAYFEQPISVLISNDDSNENPYNFGISGEGAGGPDVSLTGLGLTIADQDATPTSNDGTNFGSTNVGSTVVRTFVIENNGTTDLVLSVAPADRAGDTVGSTLVDVFGSSDFTILSQPTSPIAAGGTSSFLVQFLPTGTGTAAATTIAFGTDDFDTPRYDFTVTGFATTPEIGVLGEGLAIADADATPRSDDGTLFASLNEDSGTDSQTFTIENTGDGPLTLGTDAVSISGAASGDFSVTSQPATSVAAAGSTTFTIEFDPTTTGARVATVSIANDDLDEAPYSFSVEGEGLDVTAPTGFTVAFDDSLIGTADASSISFSFAGAESGASYDYTISSDGGGSDVTGIGTISTAADTISGVDVSGLGDGELTLSVTLTDGAGNESDAQTATADLDQTAPDVAITGPSATQMGAFTATFTFTEDVAGFALGDIDVANGAASGFAGSGAVYTATITPSANGTVTVDVDAAAAQDAAGNDATAATQFLVEADVTPPTVAISGPTAIQSGTFTVTFIFSEDVSGFAVDDIAVGNGAAGALSGSGDTYTADITPAANGSVTVDVAADAADDAAGNGNTVAPQFSVEADIALPTVTIAGPTAAQTGAFTITVTFSEDVTGFALGDLVVGNGTAGSFAGADDVYTAVVTPTADGAVTVDIAADVASDVAGNGNAVATQYSVDADLTAPSVAISGPTATQTGAFTVSFSFSESVTGFVIGDIVVGNGTASDFSGSGTDYEVLVTPSADGTVTVDVAAAVAQDEAGNDNTIATQFSVEADITAPTVAIAGPSATQVGAFSVDVTFSESVTGFALADVSVGNGTASGVSGSGTSYSVTITPAADGAVTVDVAADVAEDAATNGNTAATQFSVDADVTAPTVTISGPATVQAGAFSVDVTFSESVTGFALADISVGNGTASGLTGSGTSYSATITPTTDGEVTVDVTADVAEDAATNGNAAAAQFSVDADLTAPTVEISGPSEVQTGAFSIAVLFNEDVTGFALADLTVGNGTASALAGSGNSYTATITPDSEGTVTVDIAADAAADEAGNGNTVATQFTTDADLSAPVLDSLIVSDDDLRLEDIGATFTVVATFSEALDAATEPTIAFSSDVSATLSQTGTAFSSGNTVFTVSYTVIDGGQSFTDLAVTVSDGADTAGNAFVEATTDDLFSIEMRRGSVTIAQAIDGALDAEFDFSGDFGNFSVTTVAQVGSEVFTDLAEGDYAVSVAELEGFTLQSISCDTDGVATDVAGGSVTISVAPTDTITCTFETLAEPAVDETTIPDISLTLPSTIDDPTAQSASFDLDNTGGTPFHFTAATDVNWLDIDPTSGSIPASGSLEFTITFNDAVLDLEPGTYTATLTITETSAPSAADKSRSRANELVNIQIPVTIQVAPREGNLTIIATTAPSEAGEGVFNYASSLAELDGLALSTAGGVASSEALTVLRGSYTLDQLATEGWDLASIACVGDTDNGSVLDPANGRVTIDLDPEEEIVCTFANRRNEDYIRLVTQSAIRSFMAARADQILTQSPELVGRMRGDRTGATPNRFAADFTDGRFNANLSTSLSALRQSAQRSDPQMPGSDQFSLAGRTGMASMDVWVQASFSSVDDNRAGLNAETTFGLYYLGADFMATENLLVGALVQYDQAETVTGELRSHVEGDGWLAGPYLVARLAENVYFDARGAWGQSDNEVNPIGTYADAFETDRWLLQANLTGDILRGNWRISPAVGVSYFSEEQGAYTDTLGFYIPSQEITIGRINAGPEIAYRFNYAEGGYLEPYIKLNALFDYDDAEVLNAGGQLQTLGMLRGDARFGLTAELANGGRITGEISVMGLGEGEFEANNAMIRVRIPLSLEQ